MKTLYNGGLGLTPTNYEIISQQFKELHNIINLQEEKIKQWESMCLYNKTMADKRVAENAGLKNKIKVLRTALEQIDNADYGDHQEKGDGYACETCTMLHEIAEQVLKDGE